MNVRADSNSQHTEKEYGALRRWRPWNERREPLAAWTMNRMVNRYDRHGRYFLKDGAPAPFTAGELTAGIILNHFAVGPGLEGAKEIIGLLTGVNEEVDGLGRGESFSRWLRIDLDNHGGDPEVAFTNLKAALAWRDLLIGLGFHPLVIDSDGRGGIWLDVIFDEPARSEYVRLFGLWLTRDWQEHGLKAPPEVFPKTMVQAKGAGAGEYGSWARLYGRRPKSDHWSRVYRDGGWLEGEEVIEAILDTAGDSPQLIVIEAREFQPHARKAKATDNGREDRPRTDAERAEDVRLAKEALSHLVEGVKDEHGREFHSEYDPWILIGMSLRQLGDAGRELWFEWSKTHPKYQATGPFSCEAKWPTFSEEGVGLGTLFHYAKRAGWSGPRRAVAAGEMADHGHDDDTEILDRWPQIRDEAFHGVAGEVVALVDPHTEADPAAILVQFLVAFSNMVGRLPYFQVSGTRHHLNLFATLVGPTAAGRKGTSWDVVTWLLKLLDDEWAGDRIQGGLVSGEGLIHHVRDASPGGKNPDEGVQDKRLLIVETELSRTLKAMNREHNTLSDVLRQAWDHGQLRTLGKNSPAKATDAYISIIGHVTAADIRTHLTETDSANGFANRFLWPVVRRSKSLPEGGELESVNWTGIVNRLRDLTDQARLRGQHRYRRDATARKMWAAVYESLSAGKPGLLGAVISRAEAQVMRLACTYAMLDGSPEVRGPHLIAAVALWDFCEASARFVFGDSLGDPDAEKLLDALRIATEGLTRNQIYDDVFARHKKRDEIVKLLSNLLTAGLIHRRSQASTGGRPAELWLIGRGCALTAP
jgi:hypothetical protein